MLSCCDAAAVTRILSCDPVVVVRDVKDSALWYVEALGCEVSHEREGWALCSIDGITIMLKERDPAAPATAARGGPVAYLRTEGVDQLYERARAAGAEIMSPPSNQPWGRRELTIRSPDDHVFVFGERVDVGSDVGGGRSISAQRD